MRSIYFERPHLLSSDSRQLRDQEIGNRLQASADAGLPWRSIPSARLEAETLLSKGLEGKDRSRLAEFLAYLDHRADQLA